MRRTNSPNEAPRALRAYADLVVRRPGAVLLSLLALFALALWGTSRLTINSNQLDLISQDLPEVVGVKRVIDMVGGSGFLMLTLRGDDEPTLKKNADALAEMLRADTANVRTVAYKMPVEFVQNNMVLFVKTEDLQEGRSRIMGYLRDQVQRASPFRVTLVEREPVKLELDDLVAKYSSMGKKSIVDDYYVSPDKKMLMMLIKPMWDTNEIGKTKAFIDTVNARLAGWKAQHGVELVEDYERMGDSKTVAYGWTGSYKTSVDDSYEMERSLGPVGAIAFAAIFVITILFFRRWAPTLIVASGTVVGTVMTLGFTYATIGQLNMVTSILGAILMGFGIDYGIHFIFRTRLELGHGKPYDVAIRDALLNAGRPAAVSAVVTAGSFFVLMISEFRGFSQFGFLSGAGTLIIALVLFSWSPAILVLLGRRNAALPARLVGTMTPPAERAASGREVRIPRPGLVLGAATLVVAGVCAFAVPWKSGEPPAGAEPSLLERLQYGVRFNYNTRALMPDRMDSVRLQDEINTRFAISSDPVAVYTPTLEAAREVYEELTDPANKHKYDAIDQVVSVYTFVPPQETAKANRAVLDAWQAELSEIPVESLPPELQERAAAGFKMLDAKPFDVHGVPAIYASQFRELPTAKPENRGYLTFIYPGVDMWNGKTLLKFADQVRDIPTKSGAVYHAAGSAPIYAKLARIVLADGLKTVLLAALWILVMHYLDFRDVKLAAASVIPLGVGLVMMLGIMSMVNVRLNFMNIIILPILLGFGVSHGLYLLHRFLEGTSPLVALRSVGAAVASSTLTAVAGFAALLAASHQGLRSIGMVATIGLLTTLVISFTVLAAVLQLMHDARVKAAAAPAAAPAEGAPASSSDAQAA